VQRLVTNNIIFAVKKKNKNSSIGYAMELARTSLWTFGSI
jgi:hypothetical protein